MPSPFSCGLRNLDRGIEPWSDRAYLREDVLIPYAAADLPRQTRLLGRIFEPSFYFRQRRSGLFL